MGIDILTIYARFKPSAFGERSRLNKAVRVLPPSAPHLQYSMIIKRRRQLRAWSLTLQPQLLGSIAQIPWRLIPRPIFRRRNPSSYSVKYVSQKDARIHTSTSVCKSSQVDVASSRAKLDADVIVDIICSKESVASPGRPYRWATWYIESAEAGGGGDVGCG